MKQARWCIYDAAQQKYQAMRQNTDMIEFILLMQLFPQKSLKTDLPHLLVDLST